MSGSAEPRGYREAHEHCRAQHQAAGHGDHVLRVADVIGLIAAVRLPLEAFPEASAPFIFVQIPYTGSTPEEVERTLLRPVEEALSTMSGIKSMDCNARPTAARRSCSSPTGNATSRSPSEARERIDAIRNDLPDDLQRYNVLKFSTSDEPDAARAPGQRDADLTKAYDLIDRKLKRRLERIPAWHASTCTARRRTKSRSRSTRTASPRTTSASTSSTKRLRAVNFSVSAGQIDDGTPRLRVQPIGELSDLQQLRDVVVADGVRLGDIADVRRSRNA